MKSGSTLIEVMVSIVILAVIAIAGAAYLAQADSTVTIQRNRLSALATANGCLEELHGMLYGTISAPPHTDTNTFYYVKRNAPGNWTTPSVSVVSWAVTNNGIPMPVTVTLRNVGLSIDCLEATVSVGYRPSFTNAMIVLQTFISPR